MTKEETKVLKSLEKDLEKLKKKKLKAKGKTKEKINIKIHNLRNTIDLVNMRR